MAGSPAAATREQLKHLSGREDIILMSTPQTEDTDAGEAAKALAQEVAHYAATCEPPRAIVLTGGATARAVCGRLGVDALRILGELQPGIPVGTLDGGHWHGVTVVTKAGGFGRPDTLVEVARALT